MLSVVIASGFQRGEKFWEKLIEAFSKAWDTILNYEPGVGDLAGLAVRMGRRTMCLCDKMDGRYLRCMVGIVPCINNIKMFHISLPCMTYFPNLNLCKCFNSYH